jgi:hypothetical protein
VCCSAQRTLQCFCRRSKPGRVVWSRKGLLSGRRLADALLDARTELVLLHDEVLREVVEQGELHFVDVLEPVQLPRGLLQLVPVGGLQAETLYMFLQVADREADGLFLVNLGRFALGHEVWSWEVAHEVVVVVLRLELVHVRVALRVHLRPEQGALPLLRRVEAWVRWVAVWDVRLHRDVRSWVATRAAPLESHWGEVALVIVVVVVLIVVASSLLPTLVVVLLNLTSLRSEGSELARGEHLSHQLPCRPT